MQYNLIETIKIVSDVLDLEYNYENNKKIYDYILEDMTIGLCLYNLDDIIHICESLIDDNTSRDGLNNLRDLENNYVEIMSDDGIYNLSEIHNL